MAHNFCPKNEEVHVTMSSIYFLEWWMLENIISQAVEGDIKTSKRQTDVLSGQKLQTYM